ncbi:NUDIX hydrolase [Phytohabitans flavus]|uniref:NUDIX hydrolase n=1 Tax=Phytohabitans flavus TaxID=1076124 RepID=A0A6F8XQ80_9ACTN|nr:NUDIX domain-containing protein [Phytohabitans flavus]BCB75976.1 NUDIX hydrolase [Phytohabitans flavus]
MSTLLCVTVDNFLTDEDRAFLAGYDPRAFPPVAVTVDLVVLTVRESELCALLIRRGEPPQRGRWALPGGFVGPDETLDEAAARELAEETGIRPGAHLEQLATFGDPGRDPRMRVVSVAYLALVPDLPMPIAGTDASEAHYRPVAELGGNGAGLAFDHGRILAEGVERARAKLEYTGLATTFLDEPFTVGDLRRVYETVWGVPLHAANFRRKVLSTPGFVEPTGEKLATGRGWAELYRRGTTAHLHPAIPRPPS